MHINLDITWGGQFLSWFDSFYLIFYSLLQKLKYEQIRYSTQNYINLLENGQYTNQINIICWSAHFFISQKLHHWLLCRTFIDSFFIPILEVHFSVGQEQSILLSGLLFWWMVRPSHKWMATLEGEIMDI